MRRLERSRQRGISLLVVMVLLLLCSLLALGAARTGLLNESLVGNQSDEQRAFLAAEALLRDAQDDVRHALDETSSVANRRQRNAQGNPFIPADLSDYTELHTTLRTSTVPCRQGLCFPSTLKTLDEAVRTGNTPDGESWWVRDAALAEMRKEGASYGQFTNAALNQRLNQAASINDLLRRNAHYWIEVFPYQKNLLSTAVQEPAADHPFVYRITAVVSGRKPGTRVVLQSVFVPRPQS